MTDRELMQQALDAMEFNQARWQGKDKAVAALRERLAQPEQEQWDAIPDAFNEWWDADYDDTGNPYRKDSPAYWAWSGWKAASKQPAQEPVAWVDPSWMNPETRTWESESFAPGPINGWSPLYTAPRQWQGLTDEEINSLWDGHVVPVFGKNGINPIVFARAIEAKLREKNA
jgi:hypothetical protein